MIKIKLSDGTEKKVKEGITVFELVSEIDSKLSTSCIGAIITQKDNSTLIDNITPINFNCSIKFITNQNNEAYEIIRHSCAHLLAHAVSELFPYAKTTIGPTTHNGFYYDFDHEPFSEEDLKKIEIKMKEIAKSNLEIKREEISKKEALELFKDNEFKIEIIKELPENEPITIYKQGDWFDLCRGPHIQNTRKLVGFKLDKSTGAYWRGDSKNKQLQRIYGFAFFDKKELNTYLLELEQAKKSSTDGKMINFIYNTIKNSFTGNLSNELAAKYPDKLVIIGRDKGDRVIMSLRSEKYHVQNMVKEVVEDLDGYGGGHEHACGANISKEDYPRFISRLKEKIENAS